MYECKPLSSGPFETITVERIFTFTDGNSENKSQTTKTLNSAPSDWMWNYFFFLFFHFRNPLHFMWISVSSHFVPELIPLFQVFRANLIIFLRKFQFIFLRYFSIYFKECSFEFWSVTSNCEFYHKLWSS